MSDTYDVVVVGLGGIGGHVALRLAERGVSILGLDRHFAFGTLPGDPRIVVASACSGHGFKFLPATGEAVAALACGETPPVDVSSFAVDRLLY